MHIPDGFLATPVWVGLDLLSLPAVAWSARRARLAIGESRVPLLGVLGAFVFAAQMMNFPVGLGTSGHLLGGALLAILLGPAPATLVLTSILILQALVFQDGGILVLGANVWNMAIAGVWAGYWPYRRLAAGGSPRAGAFVCAALSVLVSAACALAELRLSGVALNGAIIGFSAAVFAVTAALEGAITVAVVQAVEKLNPGWIHRPAAAPGRAMGWLAATAVLLAVAGVLLASGSPDGLESLAARAGIAAREQTLLAAPLADYELPLTATEWPRKAGAGLAGLGLIYGGCLLLGRWLRPAGRE